MKTIFGGFISMCKQATTLAQASAKPQSQLDRVNTAPRRSLSNETVAQIKKELRTLRVIEVARLHGLKPSVVRAIKDELNYKDVKAAP